MSTSEISNENVIMSSFNDVPEEVHKAFEERKKAREEMQELECYAKDRHGFVTQIKEPVLLSIDFMKEVHTVKVLNSSTSVPPRIFPLCFLRTLNSLGTW
jgi:hypothetical protein